MSIFLDDHDLGPAITKLMKGAEPRCAVAFWGNGAFRKLFKDSGPPSRARVICDLTMGGTNPAELMELGAPGNQRLKHIPKLHAKIYLSEDGLIVCSANASNNGIGFIEAAQLLEAGTFHDTSTTAYKAAVQWFETLWKNAATVDDAALERAWRAWMHPSQVSGGPRPPRVDSLLDAVLADQARFQSVGFAFTDSVSTLKQRNRAVTKKLKINGKYTDPKSANKHEECLREWPVDDVYAEWSSEDVNRWPKKFIGVHWEKADNQLSYWFYERAYDVDLGYELGTVFARPVPELKDSLGFKASAEEIAQVDEASAAHIFDYVNKTEHYLFANGEELARLLRTLPPWR